jgi:hypothetical protein
MAKARNYRQPLMVVHQSFVDDTTATAVAASVHISGPHANFVSVAEGTEDLGFLGTYSGRDGLHVELPRCLVGNVLDRSSVQVVLKNALLRYFRTTTESFILPANTRNIISASESLQSSGFSFRANGNYGRAGVFGDRDVRAGDAVHVYANIGGTVEELWTTVAAVTSRYQPGTVTPEAALGAKNAAETTAAIGEPSGVGFPDLYTTPFESPEGWDIPLRNRGAVTDTYTIETVIGGAGTSARFRITSLTGDNFGSVSLVADEDDGTDIFKLKLGSSDAFVLFAENAEFTVGSTLTVTVTATVELNTPTAGGSYTAPYSEYAARESTYVVTVTKGGAIPATAPENEAGCANCPSLSITTADGSDKTPVVRVYEQGTPVSISRYGVTLTFDKEYLIEGDKFYITCHSAFSDIVPTLVLNQNVPDNWVSDTDADVSIELFAVLPEIDVPEYSMTASGRVVNWTIEAGGIQLRPGVSLYTPSWSVNGEPAALEAFGFDDTKTAQAYMRMRYFIKDAANTIISVTNLSELNEALSGPISADNPLKWAAYYALNNGAGSTVLLTAVPDPTSLEDWRTVTDLISERDDVFHVLPLAYGDKAVEKLFYEHIQEMNVDETAKERVLYLISNDQQTHSVLTDYYGNPVVGKLSIETGVGSSQYAAYTNTTLGVDFIASGIRAGDVLRTNFDFDLAGQTIWKEYIVEEVINTATLRLTAAADSIEADEIPMAYEIWRTQTNAEFADSIANTGGFQDMLVRYIYTDNAEPGFDQIAPASALIGLIGSVVPHQGVSWYPLSGFTSDNWVGRFSNSQLNHMGGNGVLLITRQQDGNIAARHAVTTAKAPLASEPETNLTLKMSEEMFIRNALLLKKEYRSVLKGIVGITNNVTQTQLEISTRIEAKSTLLKDSTAHPLLGGRIIEGPIDLQVQKHQLFLDALWVNFTVTGPLPLNRLDCRLYI